MANTSLLNAFERMWQHVVAAIGEKSDKSHIHDDRYYTESEIDTKLSGLASSSHSHTITASASDDDVVILTGTNGTNKVTYSASHANSGVTAGTYKSVTVNAKGHVTAGTNPTTLSGYGITDAYTKTQIDTSLSGKASSTHNHDDKYDAKGSATTAANTALDAAKSYTDTKVSGMATTTVVDNKISTHNTSTSAHNDIRDLITGLTTRLNTLADSDDTTLDQMSEIVAYIKSNKSLIDSVTTNKVNVADIVDNLTTSNASKVLSAKQGVALKSLIDNLQTAVDGKAASEHTHNYAGSSSAGGAATSANKVNSSLTVKLNSGTTEGTNMFTFNGSAAKSVNITPSAIGAAASSHTHDDRYYTETEIDSKISTLNTAIGGKAASSHGNHVPTTQTANNAVFLRNDNTWQTVTPANIGAYTKSEIDSKVSTLNTAINGKAASSHTHTVSNITDLTATATELNYMDGVTSNVQTQLNGKAASSHGNHVPTTQTANNAVFLRNDNTWQTVTPANIGAAPAPTTATITLSRYDWSASGSVFKQTVTVSGVSSDETAQLITITPKISSQSAYINSEVYASGQADNSITFTCTTKPTVTLTVYAVIQEV